MSFSKSQITRAPSRAITESVIGNACNGDSTQQSMVIETAALSQQLRKPEMPDISNEEKKELQIMFQVL